MTDNEKIAMLKTMTDETDDSLLSTYLVFAKQQLYEYVYPFGEYPETMPEKYDGVHVEIAAYNINKRGAEGEIVHLENGLSRHWEDGSLPASILSRLVPKAKVI